MQALTAGSIDIALGGGPALAAIVKGVPMKAVAVSINAPNIIMLVVLKDGPVKSVDDLKGRTVSVSTARLADLLADAAIVALAGLGRRRHQDHAARRLARRRSPH